MFVGIGKPLIWYMHEKADKGCVSERPIRNASKLASGTLSC